MGKYAKAIVAAVTAVLVALNNTLPEGHAKSWVAFVLAAAGAFGVYAVPNAQSVQETSPAPPVPPKPGV